jgi:hypothetical protein
MKKSHATSRPISTSLRVCLNIDKNSCWLDDEFVMYVLNPSSIADCIEIIAATNPKAI